MLFIKTVNPSDYRDIMTIRQRPVNNAIIYCNREPYRDILNYENQTGHASENIHFKIVLVESPHYRALNTPPATCNRGYLKK